MAERLLVNPARRKTRRSYAKKRKSPAVRTRTRVKTITRYRRNPSGRSGGLMGRVTKSATGAGGALLVEAIMSRIPIALPQVGIEGAVAKGVVGIGAGWIISKLLKNRGLGANVAEGATTIAMYQALAPYVSGFTSPMPVAAGQANGMGEFLNYSDTNYMMQGMGYMNAAQTYPYSPMTNML